MSLVQHTFTAADGTAVGSTTPEIGGAFVQPSWGGNVGKSFVNTNRATKDNQADAAIYYSPVTLAADCWVKGRLRMLTSISVNVALVTRLSTSADTYIWARHNRDSNLWSLRETVNSSVTELATFSETLVAGDERDFQIECFGNQVRLIIAGVDRTGWKTTSITSAGKVGFRFSGAASQTTGYAFDDIEADNLTFTAIAAGVGVAAAQLNGTVDLAASATGTSSASASLGVPTRPLAPSGLTATTVSSSRIDLSWTDNSNNEDDFRIERSPNGSTNWSEISTSSANTTTFSDTGLSAGTTYFYRVRAHNVAGYSNYTYIAYATTSPAAGITHLKVYEANLQGGIGTDEIENISRQTAILSAADIIGCSEVSISGIASWDSGLTGFTRAVSLANDPSRDDGNAIWVRTSTVSIVQTWTRNLVTGINPTSNLDGIGWDGSTVVRKSAVAAKCQKDGKQFYVVSTHLAWSAGADSNGSVYSQQRVSQINDLKSWIGSTLTGGLPVILIGDLNLAPTMPRAPELGFTADASTDVITATSHPFTNGTAVTVRNTGGSLPTASGGGLATGTLYYVRDVTTNTLKLARTLGGAAIDITANGSGSNFIVATQLDLLTNSSYANLWELGLTDDRACVPWGDRDLNGQNDMPRDLILTRTHDTRFIDYALLLSGNGALGLQSIILPDVRSTCSATLVDNGGVPYCSDVAAGERLGSSEDFGVRPSDHNWLLTTFNIFTSSALSASATGAGTTNAGLSVTKSLTAPTTGVASTNAVLSVNGQSASPSLNFKTLVPGPYREVVPQIHAALALLETGSGSGGASGGNGVIDPADYGALADAAIVEDATISLSTPNTLSSAGSSFTPALIGKSIAVAGAGASGATLVTTISAVLSTTSLTLVAAASTAVTNTRAVYGTNNTTAVQNALNAAAIGASSNTVLLANGNYLFASGSLNVPQGVQLQGTWQYPPDHMGYRFADEPKPMSGGTTLVVVSGEGSATGRFLLLNSNSGLRGVVIFHPAQTASLVTAKTYPWAIEMYGAGPTVENVELVNPYQGIYSHIGYRHRVANIKGTPLLTGVYASQLLGVSHFENITFEAIYTFADPESGSFPMSPLMRYIHQNCTAFKIGRVDGASFYNCFSFACYKGFKFVVDGPESTSFANGTGAPGGKAWAQFTDCGADTAPYPVDIDDVQGNDNTGAGGVTFSNSLFASSQWFSFAGPELYAVFARSTFTGRVGFSNCRFHLSNRAINVEGGGRVNVTGCFFQTWATNAIRIAAGTASVTGCTFKIGSSAPVIIVTGNPWFSASGNVFEYRDQVVWDLAGLTTGYQFSEGGNVYSDSPVDTQPTLQNGWADLGAGYKSITYTKRDGRVYLSGTAKDGTTSSGTPIFILPAGFRPPAHLLFTVHSNGALGVIQVATSGVVSIIAGSNVSLSLDGISFAVR